jgi:hypothetical protein
MTAHRQGQPPGCGGLFVAPSEQVATPNRKEQSRRANDGTEVQDQREELAMTTVSDVLHKAADLIEKRGWAEGEPGWGTYGGDGPLCLEGGIIAAASAQGQIGRVLIDNCPAAAAVHEYLQLGARELWEWNDVSEFYARDTGTPISTSRTQAEVIEVLRAAAAIERAREDAAEAEAIIQGALSQPVAVFEVAK